jgi:hypothetical protein
MGSQDVTAVPQVAKLSRVEESPTANQGCGDEEMPPPASPAQLVADAEGALAIIVEGQKQMLAGPGEIDVNDQLRLSWSRGNLVQMLMERTVALLRRSGAGLRFVESFSGRPRPRGDR